MKHQVVPLVVSGTKSNGEIMEYKLMPNVIGYGMLLTGSPQNHRGIKPETMGMEAKSKEVVKPTRSGISNGTCT